MNSLVRSIYKEENDIFGDPQEYKGIKLYPIKIKDLKYRNLFYQLFTQPKNYIPNREILRSSYLKFLIYIIGNNSNTNFELWVKQFLDMMKYLTKEECDLLHKIEQGSGLESISLKLKIGEKEMTEQEFDDIREIILEQQGTSIEYIEEYDPSLEKYLAFMHRETNDIDFSDQVFTMCTIMKIGLKEVKEYTVYQFNNILQRLLALKEYDLYKPLLLDGRITLKSGEIKHYFYHNKKEGRYSSILVDFDEFMGKNEQAFKSN